MLLSFSTAFIARSRPTQPPGRIPSSTAARVACIAFVDPILSLLHLDFCGAAHADHRHPARELGDPLLELLPVVV
jgi:hypothetical protein